MNQPDPSQLRISDEDRHKVSEILRDAAAEGRIDLEELDERLEAAYAAKVYADLIPITADIPGTHLQAPLVGPAGGVPSLPHPGSAPMGMPPSGQDSSLALFSGAARRGPWQLPASYTAVAVMAGVVLDLREASFESAETLIRAYGVMAPVKIYVNAGTHVVVDGLGILAGFKQGRDRVPPAYGSGAPVVRVTGLALTGPVTVTRKQMPGEAGKIKKMLGG